MDFSGHYVLAWKRGIAVLSAGNVKVSPDPRISLVNGYSLEIKEAGPQDAGDYVCQIGTLEPREITHTVEILGKYRYNSFPIHSSNKIKKEDMRTSFSRGKKRGEISCVFVNLSDQEIRQPHRGKENSLTP